MQDFQTAVEKRIGKDYVDWKYNDRIFISAPTGSGKTTFILHTLLPYYSSQNLKILYLVNRRILKEQIKETISYLFHDQNRAISVMLYQEIEKKVLTVSDRHKKRICPEDMTIVCLILFRSTPVLFAMRRTIFLQIRPTTQILYLHFGGFKIFSKINFVSLCPQRFGS